MGYNQSLVPEAGWTTWSLWSALVYLCNQRQYTICCIWSIVSTYVKKLGFHTISVYMTEIIKFWQSNNGFNFNMHYNWITEWNQHNNDLEYIPVCIRNGMQVKQKEYVTVNLVWFKLHPAIWCHHIVRGNTKQFKHWKF